MLGKEIRKRKYRKKKKNTSAGVGNALKCKATVGKRN